MELSLGNYKTSLPKELLKKAENNKVRECDEAEKRHFVAYVDEADETFDVSLTFSPAGKVVNQSCDCKNSNFFCSHKTALLVHIAKGAKITQSVKAKKISKAEALLDEAEPNDLKEWVRDLLRNNKDIELSFAHYFSAKEQQYTPTEVVKLTDEAVKAVVKSKKNIDPTQLKKLVELWKTVHSPIVKMYLANVTDENAFINFHTIMETCLAVDYKLNTSSNRIVKYLEDLLQQSTEVINNLFKDEAWKTAISHFTENVYNKDAIRLHYLNHLKNIISISNETRRNILIDQLATLYKEKSGVPAINIHHFTKFLFSTVEEYGLTDKYFLLFEPITFDNEFNLKLIRIFIGHGELNTAKEFCEKQINVNFREEYNIPYLQFLKEIYVLENDERNLTQVLSQLLPHTYSFEDFIYIYDRISNVEEQKKWKAKVLARARTASKNYNRGATEFVFRLFDAEKRYLKMIENIDTKTPYSIILEYFHPMASASKESLLLAIIKKNDDYFKLDGIDESECFPQLLAAISTYFTKEFLITTIKQVAKQSYYSRPNSFIEYVLSSLTHLK